MLQGDVAEEVAELYGRLDGRRWMVGKTSLLCSKFCFFFFFFLLSLLLKGRYWSLLSLEHHHGRRCSLGK